jgi:hypothetical protein
MPRRKKDKSVFGSLGRATKRRRGKKREFGAGIAEGMSKRAFGSGKKSRRNASNSRMVQQAASAWANRMTKTERYDERERILDEAENNPKRLAEEIRRNRLAAVFPWIRRIAGYLAAATNRKEKQS